MAKSKKKKIIPPLGKEIIVLFTRRAGAMAHKLSRRRKTRNKQKLIDDSIKEY